jgi:hypothetical protein
MTKKRHLSKKGIVAGLSVLLIGTTAIKDNVHFGGADIHNPTKNHYFWGLGQEINVKGDSVKGDIWNVGLTWGRIDYESGLKHEGQSINIAPTGGVLYRENSKHEGDTANATLFGGICNSGNHTHNGNSLCLSFIGGTRYSTNSIHNGNNSCFSLIGGIGHKTRSTHNGNSFNSAIFGGTTYLKDTEHNGNSTLLAIGGWNKHYSNSVHNGNFANITLLSVIDSKFYFFPTKTINQPIPKSNN